MPKKSSYVVAFLDCDGKQVDCFGDFVASKREARLIFRNYRRLFPWITDYRLLSEDEIPQDFGKTN